MNKKIGYFLGFGIGLWAVTLVLQNLILVNCKGGLGCLAALMIFATPGLVLDNFITVSLSTIKIVNIIFYFIIGGFIGLLINKFRGSKK